MGILAPKFVDGISKGPKSGYFVTNEEPAQLNDMLGKIKVNRALTIASGGEILIFCLLKRAKEIIAVDHSYHSLSVSYLKMLLLQHVPPRKLEAWVRALDRKELDAASAAVYEHLPQNLKAGNPLYGFNGAWQVIRREWCSDRLRLPTVTKADINRVTFLYADIRDVRERYGTFDLLYVSNAEEHVSTVKNGRESILVDFAALLNPGGYLLASTAYQAAFKTKLENHGLKVLDEQRGWRTSWFYFLSQKPEAPAAATA